MESKVKKPPIEIDELLEEEEGDKGNGEAKRVRKLIREKPKPGDLGYAGNKSRRSLGGSGRIGGGGRFNQRDLTLVGLAVLIAVSISFFVFTRRGDSEILLDNQQVLQTSITAADGKADDNKSRIDNIVASYATNEALGVAIEGIDLSSYVTSEALSGYVTTTQLDDAVTNLPSNNSSCYGYLTEGSGVYTLHVEASPGTYLARISLIYPTPHSLGASNISEAFGAFNENWTGRNFVPGFGLNGTGWEVVSAFFYTSTFDVTGDSWSSPLGAFSASGSYVISVEIIPALKPGAGSGGGGGI